MMPSPIATANNSAKNPLYIMTCSVNSKSENEISGTK